MNAIREPDNLSAPAWKNSVWIVCPVLVLIALVMTFRYLPILDYPDWLYQGFLLKEIWAQTELGKSFMMTPYLPPNSLVTLLIGLLSMIMPTMLAGKTVLALSLASMYLGMYLFLRTVSTCGRTWCGLVAFLLTPGYFLFQGNLGYLLGMGIALSTPWVLGRSKGSRPVMVLTMMLVASYLAHFVALAFLLLFVFLHALQNRQIAALKPLLLPLIILVLLFAHYAIASRPYVQPHYAYEFRNGTIPGLAIEQMSMFVGPLKLFRGFNGVSDESIFREGLNFLTLAVSFGVMLGGIGLGLCRRNGLAWLAVFLAGVAVALPTHLGGMYRPGERLVPVVMAISFGLLWEYAVPARKAMTWSLALLVVAMFAYHVRCTAIFNHVIADPGWQTAVASPQRYGWHYPFCRFHFYQAIENKTAVPGAYATGMVFPRRTLPVIPTESPR